MTDSTPPPVRTNADFAKLFQRQLRSHQSEESVHTQRTARDELEEEASSTQISFSQSASFARSFTQPPGDSTVNQRQPDQDQAQPPADQPAKEQDANSSSSSSQPAPALTKQEKQRLAQLGKWEKHTKGFGMKMLEKMGFKGRLGKNEQGISSTLEVVQRPAQMGIGFGDFREASMLKHNQKLQQELRRTTNEQDNNDEESDTKRHQEPLVAVEDDTLWRKRKIPLGSSSAPKKYKKASEIVQQRQEQAGGASSTTRSATTKRHEVILDMRGPDVRVLQNVSAAYELPPENVVRATHQPKLGDELIYNVHMVVNLAQGRVYDLSQKLDTNKQTMHNMRQEIALFNGQLEVQARHVDRLQQLVDQLTKLETRLADTGANFQKHGGINDLVVFLSELRDTFAREFEQYKVVQLIPTLVIPVLKEFLSIRSLDIAAEVDEMVAQFRNLQLFLWQLMDPVHEKEAQAYTQGRHPTPSPGSGSSTSLPSLPSLPGSKSAFTGGQVFAFDDPLQAQKDMEMLYNYVLEETLWPMMTHFINVRWRVTSDVKECMDMVQKFRPHLSGSFERALLHRVLIARLQLACQQSHHRDADNASWALTLSDWLVPWQQVVGEESFARLYPDIRFCVANALNNWHPSDESVIQMVLTLRDLWSAQEFAQFTNRHVVPKLVRCLKRDLTINPQRQSLEPLKWVLAWQQVLPKRQLIALLEGEFFPKWLQVLRQWVSGTPNLEELVTWYCGWKKFFAKQQLAQENRLLVAFHGALVLLEAAATAAAAQEEPHAPTIIPQLNPAAPRNYQDALTQSGDQSESDRSVPPSRSSSPPAPAPTKAKKTTAGHVSLKDVVESLAVANDLVFLPKGTHDGLQVYLLGKKHILIDQGVVFVEETKGNFRPVDLEQLL